MKSRTLLAVVLGGALLAAAAFGAWTSASQGPPDESPIAASRFGISIDGVQVAIFSELAGISSGIDAEDVEWVAAATGPSQSSCPASGLRRPSRSSAG